MTLEQLCEPEFSWLKLRMHVFDEIEISEPGLGVVQVTGHRDVPAGGIFGQGRAQLAPIEQPRFQVANGVALWRASFETAEIGCDLQPIAEIHLFGQEPARLEWR